MVICDKKQQLLTTYAHPWYQSKVVPAVQVLGTPLGHRTGAWGCWKACRLRSEAGGWTKWWYFLQHGSVWEGRWKDLLTLYCDYKVNAFSHCCSSFITETAVFASSPVVGSSKNKTWGSIISSIPMLVLFLSPPDTPRINSVPTWKVNFIHGYSFTVSLKCLL